MDFNRLEKLKKLKKLSYEELAEMVGMSKNGLNLAIKNKDLKVSTLEKLANILGVPVAYFFEEAEQAVITNSQSTGSCGNCHRLEKLIESEERMITRLEEELEEYRTKGGKSKVA